MKRLSTGRSSLRPAVIGLGMVAIVVASAAARAGQSALQLRALQGFLVTFEVTQSSSGTATSTDQITILFSNVRGNSPQPPTPMFGDDIQQEFSFSALDVPGGRPLQFSRRVKDKSFLDAAYVRVVNHGGDGWNGAILTMRVDGELILDRVDLSQTQGEKGKGLQDYNRRNWRGRTYWEGDLKSLRGRAKGMKRS